MPRQNERLSDLTVKRAKKPGAIADGRGLYLQIGPSGTKSWLFRFMRNGRERWMGLGSYPDVSLANARDKAHDCRRLLRDGLDPIEQKRIRERAAKLEAARATTFKQAAEAYVEAHRPSWKNAKHAAQWSNTLETYVYPVFGKLSAADVDTTLVLKALEPIWQSKTETATRVRQRIEAILDWAAVRGYRTGDNPARWRGHLDKLLAKPGKVRSVEHHAALAFHELPAFFEKLRRRQAISAQALAFAILTAARSGEVRGMTWREVDLDRGLWIVPGARMKSGRSHRVPLSDEVVTLLREVARLASDDGEFVFSGRGAGKAMSENTMRKYLQEDMARPGMTVHGFRSSFRDWAAERTNFPREVAEAALAHVKRDKTEAAYQRGDFFDRRRQLMDAWARYCTSAKAPIGEVLDFNTARPVTKGAIG